MNRFFNFITENGLAIGGFFMILISCIVLRNGYLDEKITEKNNYVKVRVVDCYEYGKRNYFLKFEYDEKTYVKRTKALYCEKVSGKNEIEILINDNKDGFILLDEYENDFTFGIILFSISLVIIYKGVKK
ncbi:hypothetical protein VP395_07565 [Mariniflexile soesokkakense]|uniref:Lipoprotein n=1 Tax=Mariniflexile soesokkakense TaxID=1343160 RepID=A0ABV0ADI5_9FLAO